MYAVILDGAAVTSSATYTSPPISIQRDNGAFALYYSVSGSNISVDFYWYASADGENFVKKAYTIKRAATSGSDVVVFAPQPSESLKIEVANTGSGEATVSCVLVARSGVFGEISGLALDGITKALQTIEYSHHEIHDGRYFTALHYSASKNDGQTISIYFKTANTDRLCHLFAKWSSGGAAYFRIYEAPTVTANTGTNGQVIYNHSRDNTNTSGVFDNAETPVVNKYGIDCTVTNTGTTIWQDYSGAAKSSGGSSRNEDEFILKKNTAYVFLVESDAAGIALNMIVSWYEHLGR